MKKNAGRVGNTLRPLVLPCPFCGHPPKLEQVPDGHWSISCNRVSCAESYFVRSTKRLTVKAWNYRHNISICVKDKDR